MGQEVTVSLGDQKYSPQEVSAIILRTLKNRAEKALGHPVSKAVITVPAFFNDGQRQATRQAGELAGLEVVRIINEPTAAVLDLRPPSPRSRERLLVYDLGGGTFDVSVAQVENGVVEILSSHGDTQLGGDDFDQLLLDHVCDPFSKKHGSTSASRRRPGRECCTPSRRPRNSSRSRRSRPIEEEFIAEKDGKPLHLSHGDHPGRVRGPDPPPPGQDAALPRRRPDRRQAAGQPDRQGRAGWRGDAHARWSTSSWKSGWAGPCTAEIEPDLAVAMGAAVQGGLIAGIDVGPILVDITPHTLGIKTLGELHGFLSPIASPRSSTATRRCP